MSLILPKNYRSLLNTRQTQIAIKKVKDFFERDLAIQLDLTRDGENGGEHTRVELKNMQQALDIIAVPAAEPVPVAP